MRRFVAPTALFVVLAMAVSGASIAGAEAGTERRPMTFQDVAEIDELTSEHAGVLRLYWAFFDRVPDPEGALYWIDQFENCQSIRSIANVFAGGPEFRATYGDLTASQFVQRVYQNTLDRSPDAAGEAYWLGLLNRGTIDRTELMLIFSVSVEFTGNHPLPSDGVPGRGCRTTNSAGIGARSYGLQSWENFATVGPVTLRLPSTAVELVGFHESNNDGALALTQLDGQTPITTMSSRNRDTNARGSADVAVHPLVEIRSPVTGTVVRAGGYILYCRYQDDFVVIEPDSRPGWEVKMLHITGVQVKAGDRVIAGETVLAPRATTLPLTSQIDKLTGDPSWPHVQIEVVDPSIPDRPSRGPHC